MTDHPPVHLVKGDDAVLIGDEVRRIVTELVGDGDRALMVEELDDSRYLNADDNAHISPLVDAAQTPPFLTDRRVVVGRHLARFTTAEAVAPLVAYLGDPLPTTALVLVWDKGPKFTGRSAMPRSLTDALKQAGAVTVTTDVPTGKGRDIWFKEHLATASVHLDPGAQKHLVERLGEDASRLGALLEVLESAYGPGHKVTIADLEPFLGEAGGVPPWELTDAIAAGDIATALDRLERMLGGGERHALQIMATLHRHVAGLLRLDGAAIRSRDDAAKLLGMAPYPAEKLMKLARSLGSDRIAQQVLLVADADLDLRGANEWSDELVLEVLVARLARLSAGR